MTAGSVGVDECKEAIQLRVVDGALLELVHDFGKLVAREHAVSVNVPRRKAVRCRVGLGGCDAQEAIDHGCST